jgi:hypothetical protein
MTQSGVNPGVGKIFFMESSAAKTETGVLMVSTKTHKIAEAITADRRRDSILTR